MAPFVRKPSSLPSFGCGRESTRNIVAWRPGVLGDFLESSFFGLIQGGCQFIVQRTRAPIVDDANFVGRPGRGRNLDGMVCGPWPREERARVATRADDVEHDIRPTGGPGQCYFQRSGRGEHERKTIAEPGPPVGVSMADCVASIHDSVYDGSQGDVLPRIQDEVETHV